MKTNPYILICCVSLLAVVNLAAQERHDGLLGERQTVKKYTIMERFEPDLILTATEREQLKADRFAEIKMKLDILDTMDISERKRENLINDVIENPFSTRLLKTLADTEFAEDN